MMIMKNKSIWMDEKSNNCKSVKKNMEVDVLIVGGGITGISVLHELQNYNLKTILVERNICGFGITSKSTAKITYLQESIYMNIRKSSYELASLYLKSQIDAVNRLKDIINEESIDCNLKEVSSYVFTNDEDNLTKLEEDYNFYTDNNVEAEYVTEIDDLDVLKGIKVPDTYVFHPLKYINYLKNKYMDMIYEKSKLEKINKDNNYYLCTVNDCLIKAKYVVIASHYPYFLFPFLMPLKSHIETSYIGAKRVNSFKEISAINIDKPCISLRYHNDDKNNYLIYLYNSFNSANIKSIRDNFLELNRQYDFDYIWSNNDLITNDYMPIIGIIEGNLMIATGYNTWGFTNGTLAGKIIADIINKNDNEYISLFNPKRGINVNKVLRFPIDTASSIKSIIKSSKGNVNNSKVIYKKINDINVAVYTDDDKKEHIVLNKCPHMKCGIVFNEIEKTWDCLCHGSRFDIDGKCINGPSNYDITFKY
jgi:glycine/D-amino acid oxidase-like deaminating enzyme/nitrite reductase/ring-hydroxylating ferredoxin subunit